MACRSVEDCYFEESTSLVVLSPFLSAHQKCVLVLEYSMSS